MLVDFKNYNTISTEIKEQINLMKEVWKNQLEENLIGVYIHGSLCLKCFQEGTSDIDILIICKQKLSTEKKISIAKSIMNLDLKPCQLEMSAICIDDLKPWKHPTMCQFHYSDFWTEKYKDFISGKTNECYILQHEFEDADMACHVKLTKQSGITVCGKSIEEVFPEVTEDDFWNSISNGIDEYDFNAYKPKYFTSNILILGRILSYKKKKRILSKYEGGLWTLNYVPEKYKTIIQRALDSWYEGKEFGECKQEELDSLREYLIAEIKK